MIFSLWLSKSVIVYHKDAGNTELILKRMEDVSTSSGAEKKRKIKT